VSNWTPNNIGMLSKKVVKKSYFSSMYQAYWRNLICLNEVSLTKVLVLWKLLYNRLPIGLEAKKKSSGFMLVLYNCGNGWRKFFRICSFLFWILVFSLWRLLVILYLKWLNLLSLVQLFGWLENKKS